MLRSRAGLEPEPALGIGGGRDRLGAVAAVEHGRAGDGPADRVGHRGRTILPARRLRLPGLAE